MSINRTKSGAGAPRSKNFSSNPSQQRRRELVGRAVHCAPEPLELAQPIGLNLIFRALTSTATSTSQSTAGRQIIAHLANVGHADRHKSFQSPDRDSSPWRATLAAIGAVIESRPTAQVTRRDVLVAPTLQATGKAGLSPVVDADAEGGSLRILKMSRLCCAARLQKAFQRVVGSFCARLRWRFSASLQTWGSQPCAASFNASQPHIRFGYSFVPGISSPLSGKNGVKRPALARSGFRLSLAEKLPARF